MMKSIKITLIGTCLVSLCFSFLGQAQQMTPSQGGLVHDAGYWAQAGRIDGPDYFGNEPLFKSAYEKLRSRYGDDYLPNSLPRELHEVRNRVHKYIMRDSTRNITGKKRYSSGPNGTNNPKGYQFAVDQLPTKITRLSYCFGISPRIMTALIEKESSFITNAVSSTGAVGLVQLTAVGGAEVMELLGYPNPYIQYNSAATKIFKGYINCYLGKNKWVDPWKGKSPIISPKCSEAITNCRRGSKKMRMLKGRSARDFDNWVMGYSHGGSPDLGLVIGAVLLKYHLGHSGVIKGLQNYNGDTKKVSYSKVIRNRANKWNSNFVIFPYEIFNQSFELVHDGSEAQLDVLDILLNASDIGANELDYDEKIIEELQRYEVPGNSVEKEGLDI